MYFVLLVLERKFRRHSLGEGRNAQRMRGLKAVGIYERYELGAEPARWGLNALSARNQASNHRCHGLGACDEKDGSLALRRQRQLQAGHPLSLPVTGKEEISETIMNLVRVIMIHMSK
jgi:hypothetical protein